MMADIIKFPDDHFGFCPNCHSEYDLLNEGDLLKIDREGVMICRTHKVFWGTGWRSSLYEDRSESLANEVLLLSYRKVEPYFYPENHPYRIAQRAKAALMDDDWDGFTMPDTDREGGV